MPTFRASNYRWTAQFFADDIRLIPRHKPKVYAAFERYSGLRGDELRYQFTPGYVPLVKVEPLGSLIGYTPITGDEIHLASTFIRELEATLPPERVPRGRVYAPTELEVKVLLILEATVLHELVHYWRIKLDESARLNAMSNSGRGREELIAQQFEKDAYGFRPTVKTLGLERYLPQTARL